MGFEVNVPTDYGLDVMEAIWAEGEKRGACAYGLDALLLLRAEKGFIVVGQDTDGTVTPDDIGMGKMVGMSKPDFVGKRSLSLPDLKRPGRKQLVGLLSDDPTFTPDEGAQLIPDHAPVIGSHALGHITSSYMSATLGALVQYGACRRRPRADRADAFRDGLDEPRPVKIVEPVFLRQGGRAP